MAGVFVVVVGAVVESYSMWDLLKLTGWRGGVRSVLGPCCLPLCTASDTVAGPCLISSCLLFPQRNVLYFLKSRRRLWYFFSVNKLIMLKPYISCCQVCTYNIMCRVLWSAVFVKGFIHNLSFLGDLQELLQGLTGIPSHLGGRPSI